MTTLIDQVDQSSDDAHEAEGFGGVNLTFSTLRHGDSGGDRHIGLRFRNISGLSGVTIDAVKLTYRATNLDTGISGGTWFCHKAESPGTFTTTAFNISDIAQRPRTIASANGEFGNDDAAKSFGRWDVGADEDVPWSGANAAIKDAWRAMVQELIDALFDPSAMVFLFIFDDTTGSQERIAEAEDLGSGNAGILTIDYTAPPVEVSLLPQYGQLRAAIGDPPVYGATIMRS